jgi:L-asparaginase II
VSRLDLDVVRHAEEPVAVKIGAQGLFCLAFPRRALGVAVKVHSGSGDALPAAVSAAPSRHVEGAWREPEGWASTCVRNVVGRPVGAWVVP